MVPCWLHQRQVALIGKWWTRVKEKKRNKMGIVSANVRRFSLPAYAKSCSIVQNQKAFREKMVSGLYFDLVIGMLCGPVKTAHFSVKKKVSDTVIDPIDVNPLLSLSLPPFRLGAQSVLLCTVRWEVGLVDNHRCRLIF